MAGLERKDANILRFMTQKDWSRNQAATVGAEIKRLRELAPKKSAQWLSDRTLTMGHHVTRSTIADLEIGRRKHVLVSELLILAAALEVPPGKLLYPALPDGEVEVTPGRTRTSIDALMLFSGELVEMPSVTAKSDSNLTEEEWLNRAEARARVSKAAELIRWSRERKQLDSRIDSLMHQARTMRAHGDPGVSSIDELIDAARSELYSVTQRLADVPDSILHTVEDV